MQKYYISKIYHRILWSLVYPTVEGKDFQFLQKYFFYFLLSLKWLIVYITNYYILVVIDFFYELLWLNLSNGCSLGLCIQNSDFAFLIISWWGGLAPYRITYILKEDFLDILFMWTSLGFGRQNSLWSFKIHIDKNAISVLNSFWPLLWMAIHLDFSFNLWYHCRNYPKGSGFACSIFVFLF